MIDLELTQSIAIALRPMELNFITYVGLLAGVFTTLSFLPQAVKAWKTKSTEDISLTMFVCFGVGIILWMIYGLYTQNLPVLVANFATLVLATSILVCKLKYG